MLNMKWISAKQLVDVMNISKHGASFLHTKNHRIITSSLLVGNTLCSVFNVKILLSVELFIKAGVGIRKFHAV